MSTLVHTFPHEFEGDQVVVPVEGSVFWQVPNYKKHVEELTLQKTGKEFVFPEIEHAGARGATIAVLGTLEAQLR